MHKFMEQVQRIFRICSYTSTYFAKMAAERKQSYKSENVLRMFFANESSSSESPDSDEHFQQYIGMIA